MNKHRSHDWWGSPENFSERKNERKISWLELFYDLVYVAAISQLTHHVAEHPSFHSVGFSFLLFSLVFWSWVNGSQYYDLHGSDSIRTRLLTFLQMLGVAAVAISIPDVFEGHHQSFAITFSLLQILITYLWWSVGFYDPSHRVFNKFYTVNYIVAFALIIISVFTNSEIATVLWIVALIFDLTPSLTGAKTIVRILKERGQVFTASATIVERFGLFTIIVLAESILGTVTGITEAREKNVEAWVAVLLAIFIAFLLWSIYFDMTSEQETKTGYSYMQWLIFLHYPLLASFSMVGACTKVLLTHPESSSPSIVQWIFCFSVAIILWMIVGLTRIMKEEEEEDRSYIKPVTRVLLIFSVVLLFIPVISEPLNSITFLSLVSLALLIPVIVGIRSWIKYKFYDERQP